MAPKVSPTTSTIKGSLAHPLERAIADLDRMFRDFTDDMCDDLVENVREHTPLGEFRIDNWSNFTYIAVESGDLFRSIEKIRLRRTEEGYESGAKSDLGYASFVEDDTHAHTILPKRYHYLSLHIDGHIYLSRGVQHPGTTGQHMFALGCEDLEGKLRPEMERYLSRWKRRNSLD